MGVSNERQRPWLLGVGSRANDYSRAFHFGANRGVEVNSLPYLIFIEDKMLRQEQRGKQMVVDAEMLEAYDRVIGVNGLEEAVAREYEHIQRRNADLSKSKLPKVSDESES